MCDLCGSKCKYKSTLFVHMETHIGIKSLMCDICGKKFLRKLTLKNHMRTHEPPVMDDGVYMCCCGLLYGTNFQWKEHMRKCIRGKAKPCTFDNCPFIFKTRQGLAYHLEDFGETHPPFFTPWHATNHTHLSSSHLPLNCVLRSMNFALMVQSRSACTRSNKLSMATARR